MTKVHKRRLLKLADFLENTVAKLPRKRFRMQDWAVDLKGEALPHYSHPDPTPDCNTAACALGWATAVFKDLVLIVREDSQQYAYVVTKKHGAFGPSGEDLAVDFFGLDGHWDFEYLFGPEHGYRTAKQEARIIRRYVEECDANS
jgi:hypothetical protein